MNRSEQINPAAGAPPPTTSWFTVKGMTCQNCVRHVTEAIQKVTGVSRVSVQLDQARAEVRWTTGAAPHPDAVIQAVSEAGFEASPLNATEGAPATSSWSPLAGWRFNIALGLAVTIPLAAGEWIGQWSMFPWFRWLAFSLALPVQILCGARFYRGAWMQLKAGTSNMDTLVSLGSTTAFLYSVWALFSGRPDHLYFMESAAIITLISIGHGLEAHTSARASNSLKSLMSLAPPMASRRKPDGSLERVPASALAVDDIIALAPGDKLPADGRVIEGKSAIDESMLTGESIPIEKKAGALVYAGTINQDSQLLARVSATGEATALANIITVIQRAQTSRAKIQRLGDRVSGVFVPIVVGIAVLTGLWWGLAPEQAWRTHQFLAPWLWHAARIDSPLAAGLIHAAGVLIVACPCAMGLATPVAIMSGANAAARRGILIRDGVALEKCGVINTILFDKTGTLTEGKAVVAARQFFPVNGVSEAELGSLAVALARPSRHPLSLAIAAQSQPGAHATGAVAAHSPHNWRELRGSGIEAITPVHDQEQVIRLGSLAWLRQNGADSAPADPLAKAWAAQGATVIGLAINQNLAAVFSLRDTLKPAAEEVIAQLGKQGFQLHMVTGDGQITAQAIAVQLGLPPENVHAEIHPEQKAALIQKLQQQGRQVAFIGDGINDAPALEQADLGIAVSQASDIAREAADIVLLKTDIRAVPETLAMAQATLRVIHTNLFWAFFYNAAAVPLAALGFLSPVLCAAAMGLSDLVVIGNALRLQRRH
jgi:P-type Cu+ transporter